MGVAYVRFALANPGHFAVMFEPGTRGPYSADVDRAGFATFALLEDAVRAVRGSELAGQASPRTAIEDADLAAATASAWALVHGLATLSHSGALRSAQLPRPHGGDILALVEAALRAAPILDAAEPTHEGTTP